MRYSMTVRMLRQALKERVEIEVVTNSQVAADAHRGLVEVINLSAKRVHIRMAHRIISIPIKEIIEVNVPATTFPLISRLNDPYFSYIVGFRR